MSSSNFITCLIDFNIPMWVLWFLLTFLSIGHTALWIVFLSTSDQFNFDIWLYNLCNFIILSMRNKLDWEKHIGRRKHIIRYFVHLFISFVVCPFCTFSVGHSVFWSSSIYGFWLPLWYLQTLLNVNLLIVVSFCVNICNKNNLLDSYLL